MICKQAIFIRNDMGKTDNDYFIPINGMPSAEDGDAIDGKKIRKLEIPASLSQKDVNAVVERFWNEIRLRK